VALLLELDGLRARYGETDVLHGITLSVETGRDRRAPGRERCR
jgi:ABC-type branched-subunit amino acid transport system ATPase component